jgi:hypothetical protein
MLLTLPTLSITPQGDHEEWCWASVTAGISQLLDNRAYSLIDIVQLVVPTCSGNGDPACEIPWPLADSLNTMHHLDHSAGGGIRFSDIQQAIKEKHLPVAIGITYSTEEGAILHYCVIKGCSVDDDNMDLLLLNPALAVPCEYRLSYDDLTEGSNLNAAWTDSFYVK